MDGILAARSVALHTQEPTMAQAMRNIAMPIVLRFLHIPGENEIRRAGALAQFAQAVRSDFRLWEIPILGDGYVIEPCGPCQQGHVRKVQGIRWLSRTMDHVDMIISTIPSLAAQI